MNRLPNAFVVSETILRAQEVGAPVVALESTVITHGLPSPQNLELARDMEAEVRAHGATPATIALLDGKIHIGLTDDALAQLAQFEKPRKISMRDIGSALATRLSGGTTVAATLFAAEQAGIRVFATGGIGGVHRGAPFEVSADLIQLSKSPVMVVCAGAKSILDLPATREVLETQGIPVIGYQTAEFPGFFTRSSGLPVDDRVETPAEAAAIALETWKAGVKTALLLVVQPPEDTSLNADAMEAAVEAALKDAQAQDIHGAATTPFLLKRVSELTGGDSLQTNLALLKNNAQIAAQAAKAICSLTNLAAL